MRWLPLLLLCATPAFGQGVTLLDCPHVDFFTPDCLPVVPPLPVPPASAPPSPPPLFPEGTMAPDTPPLMKTLLAEPTLDNAKAFLDWHQQRMARVQEVQRLLKQLSPPLGKGD